MTERGIISEEDEGGTGVGKAGGELAAKDGEEPGGMIHPSDSQVTDNIDDDTGYEESGEYNP